MAIVRATFFSREALEQALRALRDIGVGDGAISIREERGEEPDADDLPEGYDPVGGARLAGRTAWVMPSAGFMLVGNSVTTDTSQRPLGEVLALPFAHKVVNTNGEAL